MTNIVKEVREQRKMTQTGLSDAVGISRRALVSIEKQQTVPSVDTALRLSKVLGVGVDKLFIDTAVTFKTTQMFRDINFKVFKKLLTKSKLTSITIDIDSSVINVEGHQEGASKGYNPKKLGNRCYNIQFAFCDELKAYVTGFVRSGNTYTANGASEMIKEIVANIKTDDLEILFRMDSGYFDEKIIETIESLGCKYLIKAKSYSTLASQATNSSVVFVKGEEGRETTELFTKLDNWEKDRRFVVSRVLKPEKERAQISLLEGSEYEYFFFVTNTTLLSEKVVISYEKRGNAENYNLINGKLEALEAKGGTGDIQAVTKLLEDSKSKTIHNVSRHLVFRNMTILFAIAAVIISIVNVALSNTMTWGLYPLGAILMVWTVSAIFRFVTKRPTVYYAGLTVGGISVVLYCMLLEYLTKTQHWVSMLVIPLTGVTVIAGVLSIVIYTKRASNYWNLAGAVTLIFGVIAGPFYTYFISKYLHFSQIDTGNDVSFFAKIISLAILFAFSILFLVKGNTTHKGGEKR